LLSNPLVVLLYPVFDNKKINMNSFIHVSIITEILNSSFPLISIQDRKIRVAKTYLFQDFGEWLIVLYLFKYSFLLNEKLSVMSWKEEVTFKWNDDVDGAYFVQNLITPPPFLFFRPSGRAIIKFYFFLLFLSTSFHKLINSKSLTNASIVHLVYFKLINFYK
jgi:hypothetical protein